MAYQPGGTYTGNSAVTLYAKWTANTWKVSYNANGGTGAPAAQTKTYGQTLKLSSTKPTRANYNFLGWGTSAGSTTVAYAAGANYTANSSITLYAVWKLAWKAPQITGLSAARCDSAGTLKEDGTCAKISFKWATDKTIKSIAIVCNGVTTNVANLTGTSGAVNQVVGANKLSTESSYSVKITVADQTGGSTVTATVAPLAFLIDFKSGGKGVAFGKPATMDSTVNSAWNMHLDKNLTVVGSFLQMIGGRARSFLRPFAGDANGDGIKIGQGGSVVIGAGESADNFVSGASLNGSDEQLRLCSDNDIYLYTAMQNGYASRKTFSFTAAGNLTAPGQVKGGSGNFPSATINNLSWTGTGLKGMVWKKLWSGTLSKGGSVTIADLPKYNVLVVQPTGGNNIMLVGAKSPNNELHCVSGNDSGGGSNCWVASLAISSTKLTLRAASYHSLDSTTAIATGIAVVYGIL